MISDKWWPGGAVLGRAVRVTGVLMALACGAVALSRPALALTEVGPRDMLPGNQTDVLLVSDIHFNPLLVAPEEVASLAARLTAAPVEQWAAILDATPQLPPSTEGMDTNWALLRSALGTMRAADPHPGMIINNGDMISHDFRKVFAAALPGQAGSDAAYRAFVLKTVQFVMRELEVSYPQVPLINALGNNDSDCDNYALTPGGAFLKATLPQVAADAKVAVDDDVTRDWVAGGNLDSPHPLLANTRILVFDDIGLSHKYKNKCGGRGGGDGDLARTSLSWLHDRLAAAHAAGQKVWIVTHLPPGMDVFETTRTWTGHTCSPVSSFYAEGMEAALEREVLAYPGTVTLVVAGHTHMDDVRVLGEGANAVPVAITPGISPVHNQNPAFRRARLTNDGQVADLVTYAYVDAPARLRLQEGAPRWRMEYDMARTWSVKDISVASIRTIAARLTHEVDWSRYRRAFSVSSDDVQGPTPANSALYRCIMTHSLPEDAQRCACDSVVP